MTPQEEPLIVALIRQRLAKDELVMYTTMWHQTRHVTSISLVMIDDPMHNYKGLGYQINLDTSVGFTIIPPTADEWDLVKVSNGGLHGLKPLWKLQKAQKTPVAENTELPDVIDMIELLLKKGEKVIIDFSGEQVTGVERHPEGTVDVKFMSVGGDDGKGNPTVWTGHVTYGRRDVTERLSLKKVGDAFRLIKNDDVTESTGDEPVIVGLMRQRLRKGEPVYIGLGSIRYFLRRIEHVPEGSGFSGGEEYWKLAFSERPGTLETVRRINFNSDAFWHLKKEEEDGKIMWRAWQSEIA